MEELAGIPTSTPSLVPQAVSDATGIILDPDTVLKEVAKDGDSVLVRFGRGPEAFTTKWRNRRRRDPSIGTPWTPRAWRSDLTTTRGSKTWTCTCTAWTTWWRRYTPRRTRCQG